MAQEIYHQRTARMWALLASAAAYLVWVGLFPAYTFGLLVDGSVGIVLGLYICSQPAANGIDLMFVQRGTFRRVMRQSDGIEWLMLNALVMLIGWFVIVLGAARFMAPAQL
jgi:EamA domain-containing membrane protein RarD